MLDRFADALYFTSKLINRGAKYDMTPDRLSTTFSTLADPTRRAILARLASGEATVTELAEPFDLSLPAISKHLKVLERAGLIARGRSAQWRPCRLRAAPLKEVSDWVERYRRHWEQSFDRLDEYLQQLLAQERTPSRAKETKREQPKQPKRGRKKH
jgi:DNA-binding transcriptional ArsR family regulator